MSTHEDNTEYQRILKIVENYIPPNAVDPHHIEAVAHHVLADRYMPPRVRAVADALYEVGALSDKYAHEQIAQIAVDALDAYDREHATGERIMFDARVPQAPAPDTPIGPSVSLPEIRNALSLACQFAKAIRNRQTGCTIKDADRIAAKSICDRLGPLVDVCDDIAHAAQMLLDDPETVYRQKKARKLRGVYGG